MDPIQHVVLGQNQQAGRHALAGFIETATLLGIQLSHILADLLEERMVIRVPSS